MVGRTMTINAVGNEEIGAFAIARRRSAQRGWRVVAGTFAVMFVTFGITYSFSSFFNSLQTEFAAQRGQISLIFSIAVPVFSVLGIFSGPLADRIGPRKVALLGVMVGAAGLLFAARADRLWQVYLGFGVGIGFAVGFSYVPSIAAVQRWFLRRRGVASGIAVTGIGLGTLCMPIIAE
jgi:MFS family permease